jgi:hypothetical protein
MLSSHEPQSDHQCCFQLVNKIPFSEILPGNCITVLSLDQINVYHIELDDR